MDISVQLSPLRVQEESHSRNEDYVVKKKESYNDGWIIMHVIVGKKLDSNFS